MSTAQLSFPVVHSQMRHQLLVLVELLTAPLALQPFLLLAIAVVRPPMSPQVSRMGITLIAIRTAERLRLRMRTLMHFQFTSVRESRIASIALEPSLRRRMFAHMHRQVGLSGRFEAAYVAFETFLHVDEGVRFHFQPSVEDATAHGARGRLAATFRMLDVRVNVTRRVRFESGVAVGAFDDSHNVRMCGGHVIDEVVARARVLAVAAGGQRRWRWRPFSVGCVDGCVVVVGVAAIRMHVSQVERIVCVAGEYFQTVRALDGFVVLADVSGEAGSVGELDPANAAAERIDWRQFGRSYFVQNETM